MEADDWRRQLTPHIRRVVVNHIVNEIKPSLPSYLEKEVQKIAARFEEKVYSLAKDKTAYLSRIRMKLRSIKESYTTTVFNSSSNPSCSTEIPLDPASLSNQSLVLQQHSPLNQSSSEVQDSANLPTTRPYGSGLTQAPIPSVVGQNCELQDVFGNLQKPAEYLLGQRAPLGHSGNYERCAQRRQYPTQAICLKNQEECLNFQQDSYLELQKSTQSVLKTNPQTAIRQLLQQQSQQVPLIQDNLPTISEQTLLPSCLEEKLKEGKLVSCDTRQHQLIGQQNCFSDLQQQRQQKSPCQQSDFQSLQSKSLIPEQQLMPQSQPAKMKQMLNLSQPYKQQRFTKSGHMNSLSEIKQEEFHRKAETSRIKYLMEVKEMCQKTINLLLKQDSVPQESKSSLVRILKELSDPKCKISIEKLDLIKRQTNCMLQLSMPRKPASSHGQLSSNVHSVKHLLQQPSQTPQLLPPEAQKESELQFISHNSAITMQQNNVTNLQDDTLLLSFERAAARQHIMKPQQNLSMSDSVQGNSVKSMLQDSLRPLQIPVSTLHQPNIDNMVSQNLGNALEPNGNSLNFSSVLPQHLHSKQKMEQHHVTLQKPKQNSQQDQIWQQIMQVKQEVPEQKQILSAHGRPRHQLNEVNDVKVRLGIRNEMQHHTNEAKNLKVRPGTAFKTGIQHNSVFPCQNLKSGVPLSSSLPRLPQSASLQTSQYYLQANQQNFRTSCAKVGSFHHSLNSDSIVPLSTPLALSAEPQFSEKLSSNAISLTNAGNIGHQQTTDTEELLSQFIVSTPGISPSPLLAKSENPDYITSNSSAIGFVESGEADQPLWRLVRVVNLMSPKVLSESVSQIGSIVSLLDGMAGSLPLYGSKGSVGEDLGAMSKTDPLARYFSRKCSAFAMGKMKRSINACPMDETTLAGVEKSDLESATISHIKKPRVEVNHALLEEIREINERLVDTVVDIIDEHANSTAHGTDGSTGTIVKCSFSTMAAIPNLNSLKALAQISPIQALQLLVPTNYPYCSPILLEKLPGEVSEEHEDLSIKAKSKLNSSLRSLLRPMSVKQIAMTWDICARAVVSEHAMQNGGGGFSSKYGTWENCLDAA